MDNSKSSKKELQMSNCGFDYEPADSIVRSQWQSRCENKCYLLYRWFVATFVVASFIISLYAYLQHSRFRIYFIYLTRWGLITNVIVGCYGAVLVTIWHCNEDFRNKVLKDREMPLSFKIYWSLHNVALVVSCSITIIYWSILHTDKDPVDLACILGHVFNSVIMFVDLLIVAHPIRLLHFIQPVCFGILYGLFSYIYYICGGRNKKGEPFVYRTVDFAHPAKAIVTLIGSLFVTTVLHFTLFWVCKLRMFIKRRIDESKPDVATQM